MELGLNGKTALVTGASEGIGMAITRELAEEGVRVAICARTESKLKATAAEIAQATGMDIFPIPSDMRSLEGCRSFVEQAADQLGGIDILVNNAGASAFGAFVSSRNKTFQCYRHDVCVLCLPPGFPAVPPYLSHTPVVP